MMSPVVSNTFAVYTIPWYNSCSQMYSNILVLKTLPPGPLAAIAKPLGSYGGGGRGRVGGGYTLSSVYPMLSSRLLPEGNTVASEMCSLYGLLANGATTPYTYCGKKCGGVSPWLTLRQTEELIALLIGNNYQIETNITNMLTNGAVNKHPQLVCMVTYYDPNTSPGATVVYSR